MTIFSSSVLLDTTFSRLLFFCVTVRVLVVLRLTATLIFSFIIIIIIIIIITGSVYESRVEWCIADCSDGAVTLTDLTKPL